MGRDPKFSGHADIKGHYQRAKFGCLTPLRGDSREGVNVSLTPPLSKFSCQILEIVSYFAHNDTANKWRKI